jgi:CubicO group peptidase (beta-lactamase class C family)
MPSPVDRRTFLTAGAKIAAACAASNFFVRELSALPLTLDPPQAVAKGATQQALDAFIERYMRAMASPGMTLAVVSKQGPMRSAAYGFADIETKEALGPQQLFQIGSVSKSFIAMMLLQLKEEGKLDLRRDIKSYVPWLPIRTDFGAVTIHDLLTHTSGLPNPLRIFPADPSFVYRQTSKPGEHFYYCNLGFAILGELIGVLDGRPWTESVIKRIFEPLGMTSTRSVYDSTTRALSPQSYVPFAGDRNFPVHGRVAGSGQSIFDDAAGSICSSPGDMAKYLHMLMNRGAGPKGRIISEASFTEFSTPYIKAEEFSPTASYGYGMGLDTLDGHRTLRHTGGTNSYMTAVQVDLDSGFAVFASINAQLGYRPNPVAEYGVRLMRADQEGKPLPQAPEVFDPMVIKGASNYVGSHHSPERETIEIVAQGERLFWNAGGRALPIQMTASGGMMIADPAFDRFPIVFGRESKDEKSAVVELGHGAAWYANERYKGPKTFSYPEAWNALVGTYHNDDPWVGTTRMLIRKGKLWMDGILELLPEQGSATVFGPGDPEWSPERAEFLFVVGGKARLLRFQGAEMWRVDVE